MTRINIGEVKDMGCNCGRSKPRKKNMAICQGCGKKLAKSSKAVKKFWIQCPKCCDPEKLCCGSCAVKHGYKTKTGKLSGVWYMINKKACPDKYKE